ncbi:c-type cytochrome [Aureibaculum conchae]|uniref:c-type cytochrome n=1 Tax=Aureibaculum sp. 2308TA14-22 TaxID=3108392 RepID=UPI00339803F3
MKKLSILFIALSMIVASCGDKKKEEVKKDVETVKEEVKETTSTDAASDKDAQIAMGKKLFTEKTCVACHAIDSKTAGPSVKNIIEIYDEKKGNIVQFLKGNADPIVDTDPGQVAIMKGNLDSFVKDMKPEELQALSAYMRDAAK